MWNVKSLSLLCFATWLQWEVVWLNSINVMKLSIITEKLLPSQYIPLSVCIICLLQFCHQMVLGAWTQIVARVHATTHQLPADSGPVNSDHVCYNKNKLKYRVIIIDWSTVINIVSLVKANHEEKMREKSYYQKTKV